MAVALALAGGGLALSRTSPPVATKPRPIAPGNLADLIEQLGPRADRLTVLFVTVDPERDTPGVMARYVTHFGERSVGLTGTPEQVAAMASAWRVFCRRVASGNGDYLMDHTASVFLMTAEGNWAGALDPHDTTPGVNLAKLELVLRRPSS